MMISHYQHLMQVEGMPFGKAMIVLSSLERLATVVMTAMTSFIGQIPLLSGYGEPGKEILYPFTIVLFGGMLASTILDLVVTPALFLPFSSQMRHDPLTTAL
jgi:Cu/Ag efflux pump CusA